MTVRDIALLVRRLWWVLVGCVLLGLIAAGSIVALSTPQYLATARLLVATPNIDQGALVPPGGISTTQRAVNYANMVTGTTIPQQVIDELHLTDTVQQLLQHTTAIVLPNTTIVEIGFSNPDPHRAQQVAQALAVDLVQTAPKVETTAGSNDAITLTDPADLPLQPESGGAAAKLALGGLAGLVVGAAILWFREFLDTSIRRPEDLAAVAGAPVLGVVGRSGTGRRTIPVPPSAPAAESFRTIRTALQFVETEASAPVFAVTGMTAGVGTSMIATNLAAAQARADHRVLLIDADLRRPAIAGLLGLDAKHPGLCEVLTGSTTVSQAVQRHPTAGLDVLTSGALPEDPTERLQSKAMDELLAKARGQYDVVVLDCPPVLAVNDAALLGAISDGVVLVVRWGGSRDATVTAARNRLGAVRARLLGSVVTDAPKYAAAAGKPYQPVGQATDR